MEQKEKKLYINTFIIFISKFFTQFLSIILLPILTASLSTEEYGSFDLISTYACFFAAFMTIKIENGLFRFLIDKRDNKIDKKKIITNGLTSILITLFIFSIFYLIIGEIIDFENKLYIYIYAVSSLVLSVPLQISRGLGDNQTYAKASLIYGIFNVFLCLILVYFFKFELLGMVISGVISNIISGIYIIIKKSIISYIDFKLLNKKESKELISYSLPLVPNDISSWILSISDKLMLSFFCGNAAIGIYSVSTKFSTILSHVYSVFNLSWTESASISSNDDKKEVFFSNMINKIFKICSGICLLVLSAMPIAFNLLIDDTFSSAYIYIPILIAGSIFEIYSGLLGAIYISMKKSKNIAFSTLGAGLINIFINIIFMRKYGIIVACFSTVISYFILCIYRCFNLKRYIKLKYFSKSYIIILVTFIILSILYYLHNYIVCIVSTLITIIVVLILNKELVFSSIRLVMMKLKN